MQLNHASFICAAPQNGHQSFQVLHTSGIHHVAVQFCGCEKQQPHHVQLLRRGWYPSTQINPRTAATFRLLEHLHLLSLTTKASTYDFYWALEKQTSNTGLHVPKVRLMLDLLPRTCPSSFTFFQPRYVELMRMLIQWRHLKLLKRGGRGHDPSGAAGTQPAELAVMCPSCPHPGINLSHN